jgi:hypothetical protein
MGDNFVKFSHIAFAADRNFKLASRRNVRNVKEISKVFAEDTTLF